ncbi:hypothetical protein GTY54_01685 [Streptomyces sp. SID625]|nr:hypothetical protein [Streptomyces sp. SID625]
MTRMQWHASYPLPTALARLIAVMRWVFASLAGLNLLFFCVAVFGSAGAWETWLHGFDALTVGGLSVISFAVYRRHQRAVAAQTTGGLTGTDPHDAN